MDHFRVATLNIWNRSEPWEARLGAIREQLKALSPEVIGLQEVIRSTALDQAHAIAEGLGYHIAWGRAAGEGGNAILSRWPIRRTRCMELPHCESGEYRSVLFAEIEAPFGPLPFFCTHLNWKLDQGQVRQRQVRALTDFVARMAPRPDRVPPGWTGEDGSALGPLEKQTQAAMGASAEALAPPVIVGDFNAEPQSDEIRFMGGWTGLEGEGVYFSDCFALAGDGSRGATFCRRNPFAEPAGEPDRRIDYIFVRGPVDRWGRGRVLESGLCFDALHGGVYPSDHFGVTAVIGCAPAPGGSAG